MQNTPRTRRRTPTGPCLRPGRRLGHENDSGAGTGRRCTSLRAAPASISLLGAAAALLVAAAPPATASSAPPVAGAAPSPLAAQAAPPPASAAPAQDPDARVAEAENGDLRITSRRQWLEALRDAKDGQEATIQATDEGGFGFVTPIQRLLWNEHMGIVLGNGHSGSGIDFGVDWELPALGHEWVEEAAPNRIDLGVRGVASSYGYAEAGVRSELLRLGGTPVSMSLAGGYRRHPRERFFGSGPASVEADRTSFLLKSRRIDATAWWHAPGSALRAGGGLGLVDLQVGPGSDEDVPSAHHVFGDDAAPGIGADTRFLRLGSFLEVDLRDPPDYPHRGAYLALRMDTYSDRTRGAHGFRRYEVEAQQYLPFLNDNRGVVLRFLGEFTDPHTGQRVPFYLVPSLGGSHDLRGLPTRRFVGRHKVLLQAEYRWEAWIGLDMVLFTDVGQVFDDLGEVGLDNLQTAYGLGFRLNTQEDLLLRADFAIGAEGFEPHFSFSHVF